MPENSQSISVASEDAREAATTEAPAQLSPLTTSQSQPFIGQWNQLISTTNWDKGKIIFEWRESLKDTEVPSTEYSDETWSQMVGGVTAQHVGRLRRTFERFGHVHTEYAGIYWSHFYAALDWDDAEMWLEGAVQSKWSVSGMRQQRWETLGKLGQPPVDSEIVSVESAEEAQSLALSEGTRKNDRDYIEGPVHEGPDWGDEDSGNKPPSGSSSDGSTADVDELDEPVKPHAIRPFESFTDLPEDVLEAAGAFKVAIVRHKAEEWAEVSQDDMVGLIDALKQLALLPPV